MITVLETGVLNSVQDAGRFGYRHLGVSTSGVMDPLALRCGNILLGNVPDAACIEVQTFPFKIRFDKAVSFVVTGGEGTIKLGDRALQPWSVATAQAGDVLTLDRPSVGARMYLCVCGGIDVPVVLGSRSTQLRGGFGGYLGRPLQADDQLTGIGSCVPDGFGAVPPLRALPAACAEEKEKTVTLRAIPATDYFLFTEEARAHFWSASWQITAQSNRLGYRLKGGALKLTHPVELRSYGVIPGIIQVPPAGEPIVQMADANTAGGYPRIATVIEADLWRLAQARIGSFVQLQCCDHAEGLQAMRNEEAYLQDLQGNAALYRKSFMRREAGQAGKKS
ncbi:biotin-dependent carboxyltransferase family protein [Acetobacter sp. P5B1]|uniref:5-oxoprolinase subunit C family protein n=1 Tax=Acetobacter sp. P5B1 TaxID=2762620 RepID=UPI001C03F30C